MDIIWHGYSCFTLKTKHCTAVFDPYNEDVGLKLPKIKADLVMVSHDHEGHNAIEKVGGEAKLIDWPGEYEVKGLAINAYQVPYTEEGTEKKPGKGLMFVVHAEDLKICFLGDMGTQPEAALLEQIGDIDILMVPVGGNHVMDAKAAHLAIEEIEPRAVIPMHYATDGVKMKIDGIEPFLKVMGAANLTAKDKISVESRASLKEDGMEIILLNPQTA
jgi:L-ascorbate metabolism protein UlaG (beta-lactamase superfamily)